MVICFVLGCKSRSDKTCENVTFHKFPVESEILKKWIASTGRVNWQPTSNSRMCSKHFEASCFRVTKRYNCLKPHSIPTLFINLTPDRFLLEPGTWMPMRIDTDDANTCTNTNETILKPRPEPEVAAMGIEIACASTMDTCNYIGCNNSSEKSVVSPYLVDDWKRLNLQLLRSGKTLKSGSKYICPAHFPPSKLRKDTLGVIGLTEEAVPQDYLHRGSGDSDEEIDFQLKKPAKVYPKSKTVNVKSYAKKGNLIQRNTNINTGINLNVHLTQSTHKEKEKKEVSVYTIAADGVLTDTKNDSNKNIDKRILAIPENTTEINVKIEPEEVAEFNVNEIVSNKNKDRRLLAIPENSTEIEVKIEPAVVPEFNVDEIDDAKNLAKTSKLEASTDLQIKIEPLDEDDIKLEKDKEPDKLEVELDIPFKSKPSSTNSKPEKNEERIHFEDVAIKIEPWTVDVEISDVDKENVKSNVVVDIKREWNECSDPEVECGDPGVECSSKSIECDSAVIGCTSDTLNTKVRAVEVTNDVDKECETPKYPKRIFKVAPDEPQRCSICNYQFQHHRDLQKHMESRHHEHRLHSIIEKNTDDSHEELKRKRQINESSERYRENKKNEVAAMSISGPFDSDEEKIKEERRKKNREKTRRWRENKRKEVAAMPISGPFDSDEEKRKEEIRKKNREKARRYRLNKKKKDIEEVRKKNREKLKRWRENKRKEVAAMSIDVPFDSDEEKKREEERKQKNREKAKRYRLNKKKNKEIEHAALAMAATKMERARQKQRNAEKCKRYRDKKRTSNLQTQNISNRKNTQQINSCEISQSTRDVPNVPPAIHTSQIAGPSSRDVPYVPPSHSKNNSPVHSIEGRVLKCHPSQIDPPNINLQTYSAFQQNSCAHREFERDFVENEFGLACDICDRLWFKKDLKYLPNDDTTVNIAFIRTLLSNIAVEIKLCATCFTAVIQQRIPPVSVYNGFKYPPFPECLKEFPLDLVTERLVSPMIPFMQIRRLRNILNQDGIFGQVINVPTEVNTMVNLLPRQADDDYAITVDIKRRKIHKSSYVYGVIKKRNIKVWLRYLKDTPLYTSYGVSVDDRFLNDGSYEVDDEIVFEDGDNDILEQIAIDDSLVSQQQTLMWNDDMYLRIARGEGNIPISLLFDEHAEELSFPQIYLGQFRHFREGVSVTPFMMAKSELMRSDRRGVTPQHLLYMAMKIMRLKIKQSLSIAFKHVGKGNEITKEQIQSDDHIHGCIETNLAFLRSIPNSAFYWAERKRDLFAMIRQYGKPTIFFTISANEIGWPKLLQLLHNLKHNAEISAAEAADLHFIEKSTLINEDAVTCALYFNKLVNVLLKILQSKRYSPFKKYRILHYFKRIEFQYRGSPHAHILAWLDNAPEDALGRDYNKTIDLIDFLTSVSASEASSNIRLQTHKHRSTCYKGTSKRQQNCRFGAPFVPVKTTMILTPMKETEDDFQHYKTKYNAIRKNLENNEYTDFQSFYSENNIDSDQEYVKIIRAGINRPRVFLKREPFEKWHNPFNPFILNVVKSNTDFQFITEEHSCAAYVEEYVNKANRGVSSLQRKIIEIMDEHPEFNVFEISKNISINLLNQTEMTTQEAAWYLLREPMSQSSNIIAYIPTIWPVERQRVKRTMKELSELEDDWFDKYEKRPDDLADISLAQFVSKYYKNKKGEYAQREEPRVIRYRNYDMDTECNEYKREMVTLHLPFRHEEAEILAEMRYLQLYDENEALILERRKEFESNLDIKKTLEICKELCRENILNGEGTSDVVGKIPNENPFV